MFAKAECPNGLSLLNTVAARGKTETISVTDKPSEAKTEVCLFKQKTRLARIRAVKIRGTNAYMRYKQNGLLIDSLEEVTGPSSGSGAD